MNAPVIVMEDFAPDKQKIANTFGRAAATYDAAASLQQRVAAHLRSHLPALPVLAHASGNASGKDVAILDMGCGTGRETQALRHHYSHASIIGLDLSDGMLAYARKRYLKDNSRWIAGDIEHMPFNDAEFDLAFSSLAIQWCGSLPYVLAEVSRILKPGGWFVFSTLAQGTLYELNSAWHHVDNKVHVNSYLSFEQQEACINESGFRIDILQQKTETLYYSAVQDLLREMKALGANTVVGREPSGLLGRTTLIRLRQGYDAFATEQGLPASYQVIYGALCKKY